MEFNEAYKVRELTPEESEMVTPMYEGTFKTYVHYGPKGYIFPKQLLKDAWDIYNMELKNGDIFVTSYQRSGTTWTQELVWLIANNLDYDKAAATPLAHRYAFLEFSSLFDADTLQYTKELTGHKKEYEQMIQFLCIPATKILAEAPSPRFVKTHLPMSMLSPNVLDTAKVVYVARDPRDVIVSCYHHAKLVKIMRFKGTFKDIWNSFKNDLYVLTPYFEHVKEAWELRHHPNMLFLFYEELIKDLPAAVRRVSEFLNKEVSPEQMERLCDHLSIHNFKNNKSVNFEDLQEMGLLDSNETFIRKGKSGGWRDYFDEEMEQEAARWIADNLRDSDLTFPSVKI